MNMENKIQLKNGFNRWMTVQRWTGSTMDTIASCGPCTWHDDEAVSEDIAAPEKGAVVRYRRDGYTTVPHVDLIGFTDEELAQPAPFQFWTQRVYGYAAVETNLGETMEDYLTALAQGVMPTPIVDGMYEVPYCWGDQSACHVVLVIGGKLVDALCGCGDQTPQDWGTEEECVRERRLRTTSVLRREAEYDKACRERDARLAAFLKWRRTYKGTRLNKAAIKAGFAEFVA